MKSRTPAIFLLLWLSCLQVEATEKTQLPQFGDHFHCSTIDPETGRDLGRKVYPDLNDPTYDPEAFLRSLEPSFPIEAWAELPKEADPRKLRSHLRAFIESTGIERPKPLRNAEEAGFFCFLKSPQPSVTRALYESLSMAQVYPILDYEPHSNLLVGGIRERYPKVKSDIIYAFKSLLLIEMLDPHHCSAFPQASALLWPLDSTFKKHQWLIDDQFTETELMQMAAKGRRPFELARSLFFRLNSSCHMGQENSQQWTKILKQLRAFTNEN